MKHVSVIVAEDVIMGAIGNIYHLFQTTNQLLIERNQRPLFDIDLVGISNEVVVNNGMFTVCPEKSIYDVKRTDLVIIPPLKIDSETLVKNKDFLPWIKAQHEHGSWIASLCSGVFLLAETGLLDNKWCSTHWKITNRFRTAYPKVNVTDQKVITEYNGVFTSGGANSYWNLLLYLVRKLTNNGIAIQASKYFEVDIDRDNQGIYSVFEGNRYHNDASIHKVQDYIEHHYSQSLTLRGLAEISGLGFRTFQRRFREATQHTAISYMQKIRVESAKKILERENLPIADVMFEVGYTDLEAFRRIFKRETGVAPMQYRKKYQFFEGH
ncbi:GlxA family transcriptional regulator [Sphingobacterium haloxyli]|uniref:AraC family transcriptional regulator n=1 Tax=Sphingobacterium haloxyli TaxID=2100533 RepID=A0A2S9IYH7_9SPHI|nr:helix-turn-helix domain-containing protein [Sphingobacterium haloxyli]PRD45583.1 AraC family transcriptional regulator [Sphingobacterium haloxyli]